MKKEIKKSVLILGASSDIGVEVTKKFLKKNWNVYAHYFSNKKNLVKINISDKNLFLIRSNFLKINENEIKKKFGKKYDSIINLVGYIDNISYDKASFSNIQKILKVNCLVPNLIIKNSLKKMFIRNFGRILNCSSIGVKFGGGLNSYNYSLSKHCSEFIPNLYKKWSKKNILINNLRIGVTNTKIHKKMKKNLSLKNRIKLIPMSRIMNTTEIAEYIFFLACEKNSFMTGETITVAGGE